MNAHQGSSSPNEDLRQIFVLNNFHLFVPLGGEDVGFTFQQLSAPHFGVTVTRSNTKESWYYQVQLMHINGANEAIIEQSLTWAKRSPHRFQLKHNSRFIEGLILRLKVNGGLFDFRRSKQRQIKFLVNCFSGSTLLSQGATPSCILLPKRRVAEENYVYEDVTIPVEWYQQSPSQHNPVSSEEAFQHFPSPDHDEEDSMVLAVNEGSYELENSDNNTVQHDDHDSSDNEQYMVLYNGNAEVVGNFRALNFYKASDINIKEDIRLLVDDYDPRGVLMKIDGVEYKFKRGVSKTTNKRFVGYIAQQIESVVPQAVQLIDGILHVDYESLIPYLSESIKQNFKDINDLKNNASKVDRIIDQMYSEFLKQEGIVGDQPSITKSKQHNRSKPIGWLIAVSLLVLALVSGVIAVGMYIGLHDSTLPEQSVPLTAILPSQNDSNTMPSSAPLTSHQPTTVPTIPYWAPYGSVEPPEEPFGRVPVPADSYDNPQDLAALALFFKATGGSHWIKNDNWLTSASMCTWHGITCTWETATQRVDRIRLPQNGLRGTIPTAITDLNSLTVLDLRGNHLTGSMPDLLYDLINLAVVDLGMNQLTGKPEVILNNNLVYLSLDNNNFDPWTFPYLYTWSSLSYVALDSSGLTGTLPEEMADTLWISISLANNTVYGTVPAFASPVLQSLVLSHNQFTGTIPHLETSMLHELKLDHNRLTGGLDNINAFTLANSTHLDLSFNFFSGELYLNDEWMTSLRTLDLSNNNFTSIAPTLRPMTAKGATCNASNNNFACPIPEWPRTLCNATCG